MKRFLKMMVVGLVMMPGMVGAVVSGETGGVKPGLQMPGSGEFDFLKEEVGRNVGNWSQWMAMTGDAKDLIVFWTNFAVLWLGVVALIFLLFAGWKYLTAFGDQEQAKEGGKMIWKVILGIMIVLGAFALVNTVVRNLPDEATPILD